MNNLERGSNVDDAIVDHFGKQWKTFDGEQRSLEEQLREFDGYFSIFPWDKLPEDAVGFDAGCGSGRWAKFVLQNKKVGLLNCIEPSGALEVAKKKLSNFKNVRFFSSSIDDMPIEDNSQDFGYCLGVLHYVPDALQAMRKCTDKLKPGAPFLVYMYYNFENRPLWFKWIWKCGDLLRRIISRMPYGLRKFSSDCIAILVYFPLAKLSLVLEKYHLPFRNIPLSAHRDDSLYNMRTSSLDRFGSRIEHRFSKKDIVTMMESCHLENISFSDNPDVNWVAVGYKKPDKVCNDGFR